MRKSVFLSPASGNTKVIAHHPSFDFSGELNLLNFQGSLVKAKTVTESLRIQRIPPNDLRRLMRAATQMIAIASAGSELGFGGTALGERCARLWNRR